MQFNPITVILSDEVFKPVLKNVGFIYGWKKKLVVICLTISAHRSMNNIPCFCELMSYLSRLYYSLDRLDDSNMHMD